MFLRPAWGLTSVVAFALLAVAGFRLWKRNHSVATAIVAAGFTIAALAQTVDFIFGLGTSVTVRAYQDDSTPLMVHANTLHRFAHYFEWTGLSAGALSWIWHSRPSPNNSYWFPARGSLTWQGWLVLEKRTITPLRCLGLAAQGILAHYLGPAQDRGQ